ncbi:DUF4190 domain-containing protein [Rhodococcus daqingensis]|uniref:DUF4190 domain-containing protein n=1 Tax=Rhodococcus daqingensis TaxID=2479363 RepID=A0ABW2RTG1_9NOCA
MTNQPPNPPEGTPPPEGQQPPYPVPEHGTGPQYPGQPYPGQPYPGQPYPGQPYPGQPYPGQPYPGQPYPGQPQPGQPYPGQPYPGQPYAAQPYPGQSPAQPRNGAGIAALVLGILAVLSVWTIVGGILLGAVAIILGIVGRSLYKKQQATNGGMSLAGILLGLAGLIISIVLIVVGVGLFNKVGGRDFVDCLRDAGNNRAAQQRCEDEFQSNIEDKFSVTFEAPNVVPPR